VNGVSSVLDALESAEIQAFISFLRAHAAVTRELDRELFADHGLTINDYEVLLLLSRAPQGMRRVDLAQQVLLSASGITRLLDGLEAAGLVRKSPCVSDARVTYAVLSEEGRRRLQAASMDHLAGIRALFAERYRDDELAALVELLGRIPGAGGGGSACAPGDPVEASAGDPAG